MARKQRFIRVPDDSKVFLKTTDGSGFKISAEIRSAGSKLKGWRHEQLAGKEVSFKPLTEPKNYDLIIDVAFTGSQQVSVEQAVRILKSDGGQHSTTKKLNYAGSRPQTQAGRVQIATKKS